MHMTQSEHRREAERLLHVAQEERAKAEATRRERPEVAHAVRDRSREYVEAAHVHALLALVSREQS